VYGVKRGKLAVILVAHDEGIDGRNETDLQSKISVVSSFASTMSTVVIVVVVVVIVKAKMTTILFGPRQRINYA